MCLMELYISAWHQIRNITILIFFTVVVNLGETRTVTSPEARLIKDLLANYTKQARPVENPTVSTTVSFGVEIVQLVNVNDRGQMITTNIWVRQVWKNQLLTWDPAHYDGVKAVRMDPTLVWIPDIVLYNSADNQFSGGTEKYKTPVIVQYNGTNRWFCPASFLSTCKIDVTYFPFDRQTCKMKFGSWTYEVTELNMVVEPGNMTSGYVKSAEWDLLGTDKARNSMKYTCCENELIDVTVTITIQRKPLFYIFNLIIPCALILSMILLGFFLPPESGERITLSITILLAMAVFLQLVGESLPRNSETVPLLGRFYITIMAEIAISLILTCWVLNVHYHGTGSTTQSVPLWAQIIVLQWLGYLLCVRRPDGSRPNNPENKYPEESSKSRLPPLGVETWPESFSPSANCHCSRCTSARGGVPTKVEVRYPGNSSSVDAVDMRQRLVPDPKFLEDISDIANDIRKRGRVEMNQQDWRYFANVMDRLFFWVYMFIIMVSTLSIFVGRTDGDA